MVFKHISAQKYKTFKGCLNIKTKENFQFIFFFLSLEMLAHLGVCWLLFTSGGAVLSFLVYIFTFPGHVWVASAPGDRNAAIGIA